MTTKHTPGPWKAQDRTGKGSGFSIYATDVHFSIAGVAHYVGEADAALIAASPDMLAALGRVARLNPDAGEIGAGMLRTIVDEARAVIAKATGAEQ